MNEQLRLLIDLQELDSNIISHNNTIKSIPQKISSMDAPINQAEEALAKAKAAYEAIEKKKRDMELNVEANNDKIEKARGRSDIKDNKAYHAHLKEIDTLETGTSGLEDEILTLMEEIETEAPKLKQAEEALKAQKQRAEELKKQLDAEAAQATVELGKMQADRDNFTKPIDEKYYKMYMELLTSLEGVAVASIGDNICNGCDMNIMPQLCSEVMKGDKIIECPQCRRILFYDKPAQDAS